ncbi:homeobox protein 2-like [Plodia interpunctella]|uniref:homeobox protein 2-like n=1 Tax=Plodia interpunctella TaxID=58824 RepID=UPI002368378B|nr:homeobox protein 2-like [Plodia interpunctella]
MFTVTLFIFVFYTVFIDASKTDVNFQKSYKNGWIPISRDEVLKRNFGYESMSAASNSEQIMHILRDSAIKVVTADDYTKPINVAPDNEAFIDTPGKIKKCSTEICLSVTPKGKTNVDNSPEYENILKTIHGDNIRRPKAITTDSVSQNNDKEKQIIKDFKNFKQHHFNTEDKMNENHQESKNSYEVIEHSNYFNTDGIRKETQNIRNISEYFYQPPKYNDSVLNNNLTSSFLNILNQYNIKPDDRLTNYILSRKEKNYSPKHNYRILPIATIIPRTYNNLNHLPVDPLIAVFLSNYGYYFPNYYGQQNSYRNLYGYLAFNNNHNNLPFGLYKVFSDTDYSN